MLKTVLVDDEINALEALEWKLNRYVDEMEIIKCNDPKEAVNIIDREKPDLVFLDIEMPEMDGFSVLQELTYTNFDLIFTTAHDEFALKAIKVSAIDYLLKPVDKDELITAVDKVIASKKENVIEDKLQSLFTNLRSKNEKISIAADGKISLFDRDDIVMLRADKSYTTVHLIDKRTLLVTKTLKEVEKKFKYPEFFRVHASYLVNMNHVKEYSKKNGDILTLINDLEAAVSRNKKNELLERFF